MESLLWQNALPLISALRTTAHQASKLAHAHYAVDALLCIFFLVTKHVPQALCSRLYASAASHQNRFNPCVLDWREREILLFVALVVSFKARKCPTWLSALKLASRIMKLTTFALLVRTGPSAWLVAALYLLACLAQFLFLPEPVDTTDDGSVGGGGNEFITNFRGPYLSQELQKNVAKRSDVLGGKGRAVGETIIGGGGDGPCPVKNFKEEDLDSSTSWLIEFYAPWSPPCHHFTPVFARLARRYAGLGGLRFGRMDASRWPDIVRREFCVDASATSLQLPTLVLFVDGVEKDRRPEMVGGGRSTDTPLASPHDQKSPESSAPPPKNCKTGWIRNWAHQASTIMSFVFSYENVVEAFKLEDLYKKGTGLASAREQRRDRDNGNEDRTSGGKPIKLQVKKKL